MEKSFKVGDIVCLDENSNGYLNKWIIEGNITGQSKLVVNYVDFDNTTLMFENTPFNHNARYFKHYTEPEITYTQEQLDILDKELNQFLKSYETKTKNKS